LQVLRVDENKGYIDLSKKLVQPEDEKECNVWYNKSKTVHSILGHVCYGQTHGKTESGEEIKILTIEELYEKIGWVLYREHTHALDAFEVIANGDQNGEAILNRLEIPNSLKKTLTEKIKHRLGAKPVKIQADIQVTCFTPSGINGIKPALKSAEQIGIDNKVEIKVHLIRSPEYILFMTCKDADKGIGFLNQAIESCQAEIKKYGGDCVVKTPPRILA